MSVVFSSFFQLASAETVATHSQHVEQRFENLFRVLLVDFNVNQTRFVNREGLNQLLRSNTWTSCVRMSTQNACDPLAEAVNRFYDESLSREHMLSDRIHEALSHLDVAINSLPSLQERTRWRTQEDNLIALHSELYERLRAISSQAQFESSRVCRSLANQNYDVCRIRFESDYWSPDGQGGITLEELADEFSRRRNERIVTGLTTHRTCGVGYSSVRDAIQDCLNRLELQDVTLRIPSQGRVYTWSVVSQTSQGQRTLRDDVTGFLWTESFSELPNAAGMQHPCEIRTNERSPIALWTANLNIAFYSPYASELEVARSHGLDVVSPVHGPFRCFSHMRE